MNEQKLVATLAEKTGQEPAICQLIAKAYETYCEEKYQRPFKTEVEPEMVTWISAQTAVEPGVVSGVVEALVALVRKEIRNKIPFVK